MIPDINVAFSPDQFVLNFCSTAKRRSAVDVSPALYAANLPRAVYTVSQKTRHQTPSHNFTNYCPIFKIFSLANSVVNLKQTDV